VLEIRGLTCGYENGFILKDVSVQIGRGKMVGVIGPNGSGKTTLLRAVTKAIPPMAGTVLVDGVDTARLKAKELARKLAVVSRPGEEDVKITVEEYVLLGRIPHRKGLGLLESNEDFQVARRAMDLTDVLDLRERSMNDLSSGERQLASIARAIAQGPHLLLLDEPTSHLDIAHQIRVLDLIKRLNRETGLTVVIVLHDLNLASQYCDRLLLFDSGFLHKEGTPEDVLTYETIESVYNTVVVVRKNPISLKPYVILVSEDERCGRPLPH
jgi:iron complex transport system ATP-binding protein